MKKRDLVKLLENNGWYFHHHGSNHDIYAKGSIRLSFPRHSEIKENLAKYIIRVYKLK